MCCSFGCARPRGVRTDISHFALPMLLRLSPRNLRRTAVLAAIAPGLASCADVHIDTLQRWCEHTGGINVSERYAPSWAVSSRVSFKYDSVRADFVRGLNTTLMGVVENRAPRMVWQEKTDLHVESLASLMEVSGDSVVAGWREGLVRGASGKTIDSADRCLFGTAAALYDHVIVHTAIRRPDGLGPVRDSIVSLPTSRRIRL
jgi:hypothetical protein